MLLTQSNYERKALLERRQKSAPFSVSQLSSPPHHVFLKPGAVPSTKHTGKHILGPAVIWSWHIGSGWIRNQLIGPGTMRSLVSLWEQPSPSASPTPFPSQSSAERDARTASVTCPAWSFPTKPVLSCSYFLVWMTRSLCCERLWVGTVAAPLEVGAQQVTGWHWCLHASCHGAAPTAAPGTMAPLESQGLENSREAAFHQPHRALTGLHRSQEPDFIWPHNFAGVL